MQQHLMQMQPMMAGYYPSNVTSDHIQQVFFFFFSFYYFCNFILYHLFVYYLCFLNLKIAQVMKTHLEDPDTPFFYPLTQHI